MEKVMNGVVIDNINYGPQVVFNWNAVFNGVIPSEFHQISTCKIAKEAWEILEIVHEFTVKVKQAKLQKLFTVFKTLKIEDNEAFDDFKC